MKLQFFMRVRGDWMRWTLGPLVYHDAHQDSQQHAGRGLHVISLAENKLLKLGRGHESDVRIADVSISRFLCDGIWLPFFDVILTPCLNNAQS